MCIFVRVSIHRSDLDNIARSADLFRMTRLRFRKCFLLQRSDAQRHPAFAAWILSLKIMFENRHGIFVRNDDNCRPVSRRYPTFAALGPYIYI